MRSRSASCNIWPEFHMEYGIGLLAGWLRRPAGIQLSNPVTPAAGSAALAVSVSLCRRCGVAALARYSGGVCGLPVLD